MPHTTTSKSWVGPLTLAAGAIVLIPSFVSLLAAIVAVVLTLV